MSICSHIATRMSANWRSASGDSSSSKRTRCWATALDVVEDVVEVGGDGADVLAVERRDEGGVEGVEDLAGDPVALVLDRLELDHLDPALLQARRMDDGLKHPDGAQQIGGGAREEPLEGFSLGMNHLMIESTFTGAALLTL